MVLYLKYRPQTLDELIGQPQVKKILLEAFKAGKLSHAYLFVGPRGTGKTSTARILAKMVNCSAKQNIPCNQCQVCNSITDGSCLDLIEIDAASNRGIDDIRNLRENIKLAPANCRMKVYIIDEVHMLTTEAFNALLKTLEEPPKHCLFILATTEGSKVPPTILSRSTKLDFKLASIKEIIEVLKIVAQLEGIKVDEEILKLIAKHSEGSFRDAIKFLDQYAVSGEVGSPSSFENALSLVKTLSQKETRETLLQVTRLLESGVQVKELILNLMDILRSVMLIKNDLGSLVKGEVGSDHYQTMVKLSEQYSMAGLIKSLDALQTAWEKTKVTSIPSLPLELSVVEICQESQISSSDKLSMMLSKAEASKIKSQNYENMVVVDNSALQPKLEGAGTSELSILKKKWTFVLEAVRPYNYSLEALLRSVKILSVDEGILSLEVPYSFHQRILDSPKSKDILEAVLSDVLSKPIKVKTLLGQRPQRVEDIANVEVAAEDEIITLASEIFNGKLVD